MHYRVLKTQAVASILTQKWAVQTSAQLYGNYVTEMDAWLRGEPFENGHEMHLYIKPECKGEAVILGQWFQASRRSA